MSDLIDRQEAIDAVIDACKKIPTIAIMAKYALIDLKPAQPELIEKAAYIRGFEQGRTQGMIDSQGGKK